jgi:hypothetical protein
MQRLQQLLNQLSAANSDVTFTEYLSSEIVTPTSADPGAPARRFADLLQAASHVRLLVPAAIPALLDVDSAVGDGKQLFEVVIPRVELEVERDDSISAQRPRGVMASRDVMSFSYGGDITHFAGTIDEIVVVGLTDDAGDIQGYVETNDEIVRSRTEAIFDALKSKPNSSRVNFTSSSCSIGL